MPFNVEKFRAAHFAPRTATLTEGLEDLAPWFDDTPPAWTVRGLTTEEVLRAQQMAYGGRQKLTETLAAVRGTLSQPPPENIDITPEIALSVAAAVRVEYLVIGSVDPRLDADMARKLSAAYPVEFALLIDAIVKLTGEGQQAA